MPHAADSAHAADSDRAAQRVSEPAGAIDAGSGVWVKRWSLSVSGPVGPVPLAAELTKPGGEDGAGDPDPAAAMAAGAAPPGGAPPGGAPPGGAPPGGAPPAGMPPAGIERELRAIHSAIADLRREVRELRAGREEDSD